MHTAKLPVAPQLTQFASHIFARHCLYDAVRQSHRLQKRDLVCMIHPRVPTKSGKLLGCAIIKRWLLLMRMLGERQGLRYCSDAVERSSAP